MLTPRNTDALISIVATELTSRLERTIKKCTFNRVSKLLKVDNLFNLFIHNMYYFINLYVI